MSRLHTRAIIALLIASEPLAAQSATPKQPPARPATATKPAQSTKPPTKPDAAKPTTNTTRERTTAGAAPAATTDSSVGPTPRRTEPIAPVTPSAARVARAAGSAKGRALVVRRRFWGEVGVSNGSAALTCTLCRGDRSTSFAGSIALGAPVGRRTLLGLSFDGWIYETEGVKERVYAASPIAQFYPFARHPAFVRLGLGLARFVAIDGEDNLTSTSVGAQVRAGYEIRLTPNYVLVPSIGMLRGAGGALQFNGERVANASSGVSLVTYGLAIALR